MIRYPIYLIFNNDHLSYMQIVVRRISHNSHTFKKERMTFAAVASAPNWILIKDNSTHKKRKREPRNRFQSQSTSMNLHFRSSHSDILMDN